MEPEGIRPVVHIICSFSLEATRDRTLLPRQPKAVRRAVKPILCPWSYFLASPGTWVHVRFSSAGPRHAPLVWLPGILITWHMQTEGTLAIMDVNGPYS